MYYNFNDNCLYFSALYMFMVKCRETLTIFEYLWGHKSFLTWYGTTSTIILLQSVMIIFWQPVVITIVPVLPEKTILITICCSLVLCSRCTYHMFLLLGRGSTDFFIIWIVRFYHRLSIRSFATSLKWGWQNTFW